MGKITDRISKQIDALDGNIHEYAKLAQDNKKFYYSLNKFISARLKELDKETKEELAKRLGIKKDTLYRWMQKGIPDEKDGFALAVALKINPDNLEEFIQKGTGRGIYAATQMHFEYLFILYHREELESHYPYKKDETVKGWIERVKNAVQLTSMDCGDRKETEYFRIAAQEGTVGTAQSLPFRGYVEKAIIFLEDYVKGTIFELYYGNKNNGNVFEEVLEEDNEEKELIKIETLQEKNPSLSHNLFLISVKKRLYNIKEIKLKNGKIPHRYELIKLGMDLRMNYWQMNTLLDVCGEHPLYSRNIYEGALLTVWKFLSEMCPEWFEEKESDLYVTDLKRMQKTEAMFWENDGEYKGVKDLGGPIDFMVLASQQVEKALAKLPPKMFITELKEKPSWYLDEEERKIRMEKRRLSAIISEMLIQMQAIRNKVYMKERAYVVDEEMLEIWASKDVSMKLRYSLENVANGLQDDYGYKELDEERDAEILHMIHSINGEWMDMVKNHGILNVKGPVFREFKDDLFKKMRSFYTQYFKE